jgi:hypothetical protein
MRRRGQKIAVLLLASMLFLARTSSADPTECREAVAAYNSAIADVSAKLRRYASCISNSQGHDDCSTEFRHLKSAQDDFENAVSQYESECN